MGAEEKNRNDILSRIVADLSVKSKGGEELSSKINRLRDELRKAIESEDTIFGKFRGLVESFREIIPDEKQRYNAAIKALSMTSKLSTQEIVKAVNNQLEELKILEKGLMPALPVWRDEHKVLETKSQEIKVEISKLREKIVLLESEEKEILNGLATREKEMELVEKAVGELFRDIGGEITYIKKKVEEFTAATAVSQPTQHGDSIKSGIPGGEKGGGEQKSEIREPSAPQDTEWQKKCPMCGGRLNFLINDKMWQCYSCAYEESEKDEDEVQVKSHAEGEHTNAPESTPASEPIHDPSPPLDVPLESPSSHEYEEPIIQRTSLSINQSSSKKKTCPVCRKKMNWQQTEKAWRCPFCQYERSI